MDKFIFGWIAGVLVTGVLSGYILIDDSRIVSAKKIEPTIRLTTDGKTIDTLFVYETPN